MTDITESIKSDLKYLPDISTSMTTKMVSRIREAEEALILAKKRLEDEIENLAEELVEEGDGWTYEEIMKTPLKGNNIIIRKVKEVTGN